MVWARQTKERYNERARERYLQRKVLGICVVPGCKRKACDCSVYCEPHRQERNKYERKRRASIEPFGSAGTRDCAGGE